MGAGEGRIVNLFRRLVLANGLVFTVGTLLLALLPLTVSAQVAEREAIVLALGLALLLVVNGVLVKLTLRPLNSLVAGMKELDPLQPHRASPDAGGDFVHLTSAFQEMRTRLEQERSMSSARAIEAQEGERRRIARELHDEIGQSLTVVLLSLRRLMQIAPEEMREELEVAHTAARTSLANVRDVAQRLRPGVLEDLGLISALASLIREFSAASGIPVESRLAKVESGSRTVDLVIYRVAQESLTNIARHSGARAAEVTLSQDSQGIVLSVRDDGIGVQGPVGAGVRGMMERALLVDAELTLTARPQGGTEVVLSIPTAREEAGA